MDGEYPRELRYTDEHEWLRLPEENDPERVVTVGITAHAQSALGDIVYLELPKPGAELRQGQPFGTVESVKSVSDLYAPASGRVVAVNIELGDHPEYVNEEPYGRGWIIRLALSDPDELGQLLDAETYQHGVGQI